MAMRDVQLHLLETLEDAIELKQWFTTVEGPIGFDTETTGLNRQTDHVRLVQFGDAHTGWAIDFLAWKGLVRELIYGWSGEWVMHNAKFDIAMMRNHGIEFDTSRVHDTRYMAHILNPLESTALKAQASMHVDRTAASAQSTLDDIMSEKTYGWSDIPITAHGPLSAYWIYGALDPVLTRRLFDKHYPRVLEEAPLAYDIERSIAHLVMDMEHRGITVDREYTQLQDDYLKQVHADIVHECWYKYALSPSSNKEVTATLRIDGVELTEKTATGACKLDRHVLDSLSGVHPVVDMVARDRKVVKLQSTFTSRFLEYSEYDGRLHPSINTIGGSGKTVRESGGSGAVKTSRMSMDSPNLQQLPRGDDELAAVVRNCIVPSDSSHVLLMSDFDQVELRVMAHLSGDEGLKEVFASGEADFFTELGKTIFNDPDFTKSDPRRPLVKGTVYATLYGAQPAKIAQTIGKPLEEAREVYNGFFNAYPGVPRLIKSVQTTATYRYQATGSAFVRSPLTGKKFVAEDRHKLYPLVNYLIQGMAAEILKIKLLELDACGVGDFMVLPVHDEIIMDVPIVDLPDVVEIVRDVMNDDTLLSVPLTAGIDVAHRWGDKEPLTDERLRELFHGVEC